MILGSLFIPNRKILKYLEGLDKSNNFVLITEAKKITLMYSTENSIGALDLFTNTSQVIKEKIDATALTSAHDNLYYATFTNGIGHIFTTSISSDETHEITNSGKHLPKLTCYLLIKII